MKIIVGLGNPGKEYENTRHNIGFFFADKLRALWNFSEWEFNKKFNAEISKSLNPLLLSKEKVVRGSEPDEVLLAKPQTFMNLSGKSVQSILDFYKLTPDDILVIHDDIDLAIGRYKIATDSSSAGHNGVQNIIDILGTQKFKRIRIGIGVEGSIEDSTEDSKKCRLGAHDYVLDKFSEDEIKKIADIEPAILEEIQKLL